MSFKFGKNGGKAAPHVTHLIDIATDAMTQTSENWTMYMEICDVINSSEEGPKDAVKAIRKKFATKNPPTITLSLSLLETCVKNCGKRFHIHIATKDFLQDFIKIISPKHSPPIDLQMTVLGLLQTWAYAFQTSPELKEVCKQYQELKNKGVEFPPLDVEKATQAHIPAKSTPTVAVTDLRGVSTRTMHATTTPPYPPAAAGAAGGAVAVDNLIDLGETPSPRPVAPYPGLDSQFGNMSMQDGSSRVGLPPSSDEFGFFPAATETTRADAGANPAKLGRPTEFEEMEKWLIENTGGAGTEGATSSEFDQFLTERAREADRLPAARSTAGQGPSAGQKVDDAALFSL